MTYSLLRAAFMVLPWLLIGCQTAPEPTAETALPPPSLMRADPQAPKSSAASAQARAATRTFNAEQRETLKAIAEAVTASEICTLVMPNWYAMSLLATDQGIDVEAPGTRAALDAESAVVTEGFREQRAGAVCDVVIGKYGPTGSVIADFVQLKT